MKIKKFPQNCLLVTCGNTRLLVDPGCIKYDEEFLKDWKTAEAILVTHKHSDHINVEVLKKLGKPIYTSNEVRDTYPELNSLIIPLTGIPFTTIDPSIRVEVTKAIHGYNPRLKNGNEVFENIGFIIDDGETRLYITSDTICFNNDYRADVVAAPVTGYGLTMAAFETALFAKECGAELIVTHLDNPTYPSDISAVEKTLKQENIKYFILKIGGKIELKKEKQNEHKQNYRN